MESRVRLAKDYSLLRLVKAEATAWDEVPVQILIQRRGMPLAVMATASGVFAWHQITDLDGFFCFFLCHIILLSHWFGLP
jgi:hypothetical protein